MTHENSTGPEEIFLSPEAKAEAIRVLKLTFDAIAGRITNVREGAIMSLASSGDPEDGIRLATWANAMDIFNEIVTEEASRINDY